MDGILRAEIGWQEAIGEALTRIARPIATDARLLPRQANAGERPPWNPADFPPPRRAATLLLVYPGEQGELTVPLTVRRPDLRAHAGEVSLPGGAVDPEDASPRDAALREAWEEIGVAPTAVTVLGTLDEVWIPVSNFRLKPFVGALRDRPELVPHSAEVASIVEFPVRLLLDDEAISDHLVSGPGWTLRAGAYRHAEQVIWGATARTLAMFASVLREARHRGLT